MAGTPRLGPTALPPRGVAGCPAGDLLKLLDRTDEPMAESQAQAAGWQ